MTDIGSEIADYVAESVIVRRMDGTVRLWNKVSEALYGWPRDEAIGRNLHDLVASRHPFTVAAVERQLIDSGTWQGEITRTTATGAEISVEVRWTVRAGADGAPADIVECGRDLGAISDMEQESRTAAHRYRNLFHAMAASFWELDFSAVRRMMEDLVNSGVTDIPSYFAQSPDFIRRAIAATMVLDVNDKTVELFNGGSREAMIGLNTSPFWPKESEKHYAQALIAAALRRDSYVTETKLTTLDGRKIDALFTVCWPAGHKGQGTVLVGVIDITDRKRVEAELRESELRYRNLFDYMPLALWQMDATSVKQAMADLRRQGVTDLRAHAAANPDFAASTLDKLRIVEVNAHALKMFGARHRSELIGPFSRLWADQDQLLDVGNARLDGAQSHEAEVQLMTLDGRRIDALTSIAFPEALSDLGINLGGAIEITERKRAERERQDSEDRYRSLFHHMPIALAQLDMSALYARLAQLRAAGIADLAHFVETDPDFLDEVMHLVVPNEINAETMRLFGLERPEQLFVPIARFWRTEPGTIRRSLAARLRGASSYSEETRIDTLDGRIVDVIYTISFPRELMERGLNVVGFVDISERKKAHAALERSEARYRNLFNHMPISLWQINAKDLVELLGGLKRQGITDLSAYLDENPAFLARAMEAVTVDEVNEHTVSLFGGKGHQDFTGPVTRFWHASPGTFRRSIVARYQGQLGYAEEAKLRTIDGRTIDVLYSIAFHPALQEMGVSLIGTLDVSDRVRAEARLQSLQADFAHAARVSTLGELTASIAHEVNQPLAAIATNGEASLRWLARREPDLGEVGLLAGRMVADARRASGIIARIRSMAVKQDPQYAAIVLNEAVQEALLFLRHEMQGKHVGLAVDLDTALPLVRADRVQLQQVIVNLAMNGIQAMANSPVIPRTLRVSTGLADDGMASVSIRDNGPGIAPEHLGHLFAGFFTTKQNGMGMGLPICQSIVEAHGGRITATNESGGGARFSFTLPAASLQ